MRIASTTFLTLGMVFLTSTLTGCSKPQVGPENLRLIASLRTALSAENAEWLEQNEAVLEQRHAAGEVSGEAYDTFQSIIALAKSGQWKAAEREAIKFQEAQRPPQQFVERAREHHKP